MVVPHYFLSTRLCFTGQKQLDCYFPLELYTRIHKHKCTTAIKVCLTHSQHYFFVWASAPVFKAFSALYTVFTFLCVCALIILTMTGGWSRFWSIHLSCRNVSHHSCSKQQTFNHLQILVVSSLLVDLSF